MCASLAQLPKPGQSLAVVLHTMMGWGTEAQRPTQWSARAEYGGCHLHSGGRGWRVGDPFQL